MESEELRHDKVNIYRRDAQFKNFRYEDTRCPKCGEGISNQSNLVLQCAHCGFHYSYYDHRGGVVPDIQSSFDGRSHLNTDEMHESTKKAHRERTCVFCPNYDLKIPHPKGPCEHCDVDSYWENSVRTFAEEVFKRHRNRVALGSLGKLGKPDGTTDYKLVSIDEFIQALETFIEEKGGMYDFFPYIAWIRPDAIYGYETTRFLTFNRTEHALKQGWNSERYRQPPDLEDDFWEYYAGGKYN